MSLFNKIEDSAVKAITKCETVRLSYMDISKIVVDKFISGADNEYLEKVIKTAKGTFLPLSTRELASKDQRYQLHVGGRPNGMLLLPAKTVWIFDSNENRYYQIKSNLEWKAFYKSIVSAVNSEKNNRV